MEQLVFPILDRLAAAFSDRAEVALLDAMRQTLNDIANPMLETRDSTPVPAKGLSRREYQILQIVTAGRPTREIAGALYISPATVTLVDMRAMMGRTMTGGGMMSGGGPLMGQNDWPEFRQGMMHVTLAPTSVSHGTVSLRVHNTGYLTHELVVLPLAAGQAAGTRVPGSNGKVTEDGSLGEASASCAAGTGDGITAGSTGWVTLKLPAGRYEIVCNLPGHYAAGMHTEFDVT